MNKYEKHELFKQLIITIQNPFQYTTANKKEIVEKLQYLIRELGFTKHSEDTNEQP